PRRRGAAQPRAVRPDAEVPRDPGPAVARRPRNGHPDRQRREGVAVDGRDHGAGAQRDEQQLGTRTHRPRIAFSIEITWVVPQNGHMSTDLPEQHRRDGTPLRILAVDDEQMLTDLLAMALRMEGWEVRTASSGLEALQVAHEFEPDALVLDIMMPDLDGMSVLRRLRESGNLVPVLFLTAKDAVEDRVAGLTSGGDDYVTKPFSLEELVARLRALLRRSQGLVASEASVLRVGDPLMDEDTYEVSRGGVAVDRTATEFELLRSLMRNAKRVLSKDRILAHVWAYDFGGRTSVVVLYISSLRRKIDTLGPPMIHTVRGFGYLIKAAE